MSKITSKYDSAIVQHAVDAGVDPYLLKALLMQESSLGVNRKSRTGVEGIAQVTKATAKDPGIGLRTLKGDPVRSLGDVNDDYEAIRFAAEYLSSLLNRFDGNVEFATTGYNEGPFGKVYSAYKKYKKNGGDPVEALKAEGVDSEAAEYYKGVKKWETQFRKDKNLIPGKPIGSKNDGSASALLAQNEEGRNMGKAKDIDYNALLREGSDPTYNPYSSGSGSRWSGDDAGAFYEDMLTEKYGEEESPEKEAARAKLLREQSQDPAGYDEEADPDAYRIGQAGEGLVAPGEYDEYTPDYGDPMMHHLQGDTPADPEEEQQMAQVVKGASDMVFGDNMHVVVRALRGGAKPGSTKGMEYSPEGAPPDRMELKDTVAEISHQILKREAAKIRQSGDKARASVFFAETGATPAVVDMVWDLAQQLRLPGASSQDEYAAAMINTYKKAAEYIIAEGDEEAIEEAEELATNMAMTKEDGSMIETPEYAGEVEKTQHKRKLLAESIDMANRQNMQGMGGLLNG